MISADEMWLCPACAQPLGEGLPRTCDACGFSVPALGDVPVLLPDAHTAIARWRVRTRELMVGVKQALTAAKTELSRADLLATTRRRIEEKCAALEDNRDRILAIFADVGITPASDDAPEPAPELVSTAAGQRGLTDYYEQIHRDWAWQETDGDDENARALARVLEAMGDDRDLGTLVVLGAGAGRLAYDLHQACDIERTLAVDINPLSSVVLSRLVRGEVVSLWEMPLIPRDIDVVGIDRALAAPQGAAPGLLPIVADAFALPLADGCADTVLTPWFIDQVPADTRDAIGVVHRLLKPGGRWLNYGPLIYPKDRSLGLRYSPTELYELVALSGFEVTHRRADMDDYLCSPVAGFARIERVHTFGARKGTASSDNWLIAAHLPVPRFAGLDAYQPTHPLLGHVAAMIDGETSLAVITERVSREHGIPPAVAKLGVPAAAAEIARACRS